MDGSFMDILRKKKESRFTRNNLSDGKKKLLDSTPSFDVEFPEYSFPDSKEEIPEVIRIMKEKKIPESEMEDLDKNNNDLMLEVVGQKRNDWIELIKDIDIYTIRLKMKYARPRPFEISEEIESSTDTDDSPAFPSGHAIEAHALARIFGEKYPDKRKELKDLADRISLSRIQLGSHYPSDIEVGEKVGKIIADAYLDSDVKKSYMLHKLDLDKEKVEEKVKPLIDLLNTYATEEDKDIENPIIDAKLEDFLDIYESNINDVTVLVRSLRGASGKVKPERMEQKYGGRLFPAFVEVSMTRNKEGEMVAEINPRTKQPVYRIRQYKGQDADKLYLDIIKKIPGLSASGGTMTRQKYQSVYNLMREIRDNALDLKEIDKAISDNLRNKEFDYDDFSKLKEQMMKTFYEVSVDLSNFKDEEDDLREADSADAFYGGGNASYAYTSFSGDVNTALRFIDKAYTYVRNVLSKAQLRVEELDSETMFEERTKDMTEERRQRLAKPTGLSIDMDSFREAFGDDFKLGTDEEIRDLKQTLTKMDRLTNDFDGHVYSLPDGSKMKVSIRGKGKNIEYSS